MRAFRLHEPRGQGNPSVLGEEKDVSVQMLFNHSTGK